GGVPDPGQAGDDRRRGPGRTDADGGPGRRAGRGSSDRGGAAAGGDGAAAGRDHEPHAGRPVLGRELRRTEAAGAEGGGHSRGSVLPGAGGTADAVRPSAGAAGPGGAAVTGPRNEPGGPRSARPVALQP